MTTDISALIGRVESGKRRMAELRKLYDAEYEAALDALRRMTDDEIIAAFVKAQDRPENADAQG